MDEIKSQQQNNSENVYLDEITIDEVKNAIQEMAETWSDTMNYTKIKQLPKNTRNNICFVQPSIGPIKDSQYMEASYIHSDKNSKQKFTMCSPSRLPLIWAKP